MYRTSHNAAQKQALLKGAFYDNGQAAFFTSPLLRGLISTSYGQFLQTDATNVGYSFPQTIGYGGQRFLKTFKDDEKGLSNIKKQIRGILQQSKQSVKKATLQQISFIFPWVFSNTVLFQPLRTMLYCIQNNMPPGQINTVLRTIPSSTINKIVNQVVKKCIKYNSAALQIAIQAIQSNTLGYQVEKWRSWFTQTVTNASGTQNAVAPGYFRRLLNWMGAKSADDKKLLDEINMEKIMAFSSSQGNLPAETYKKLIVFLSTKIMSNLKCYGQVIINFDLIRQFAVTKTIQGQIFYFFNDRPDILFSIQNSFARVYRYLNDNIQLIPEGMFNIQYLRGLVVADLIKFTGRVVKDVDTKWNQDPDREKTKQNFRGMYMKGDNLLTKMTNKIVAQQLAPKDNKQAAQQRLVRRDIDQWINIASDRTPGLYKSVIDQLKKKNSNTGQSYDKLLEQKNQILKLASTQTNLGILKKAANLLANRQQQWRYVSPGTGGKTMQQVLGRS